MNKLLKDTSEAAAARVKGFTILEILVVLAVLAILIAIAVPRIKGMQDQAGITRAKSELKTIQSGLTGIRLLNYLKEILKLLANIFQML